MTQDHEIEIRRIVIYSEGVSPLEAQSLADAFERTLIEALGRGWEAPPGPPAAAPVQVEWTAGASAAEIGRQAALGAARAIRPGV